MHRGQKPSLPSPATLEISRKDRIRRQGQMPQGAELLCLVGPGHGHPASPPSVPLQVMQQIASGFKSAEVTSATLSAADAALAPRHRYFRRRLVHDCQPGWELVAQLYSGCGRKVVSNSGVVPSERYRKFGLSAGANEIRNLGLAVYGPRRGRAANRHLARGPELNTGPQPVVPGSPFGRTPAETFVRVGPRVRIRFPPAGRWYGQATRRWHHRRGS